MFCERVIFAVSGCQNRCRSYSILKKVLASVCCLALLAPSSPLSIDCSALRAPDYSRAVKKQRETLGSQTHCEKRQIFKVITLTLSSGQRSRWLSPWLGFMSFGAVQIPKLSSSSPRSLSSCGLSLFPFIHF